MNPTPSHPLHTPTMQNGSGAAAILSASIGCLTLAILSIAAAASSSLKAILTFYKPTGPLSGVTTVAILVWLVTWAILDWRWKRTTLAMARINIAAFVLLVLAFLLTFPPIANLF
ncbi:MAG: hypothetical protein ACRD3K_04225 [Edaphobacter sp.]